MKELFTINSHGIMSANEKKHLYHLSDFNSKKSSILDSAGNPTNESFHDPEELEKEPKIEIDDPDLFDNPVNGFYIYTTHEYYNDPDGVYGCFGIKKANGEKLTEECFCQVGYFSNGLCPVCLEDGKWGCINEKAELIIPYHFFEAPIFNKYGVACGNNSLIDMKGQPLPETELNYFGGILFEKQRYYEIALWPDDIDEGNINFYDTKMREYIAKGIPDEKLDLDGCEAGKEVILSAIEMLPLFNRIEIEGVGTFIAYKDNSITVFDYYA